MLRRFYIAGFSFGLIGVVLGAFATHGLKPLLTPEAINSFETGAKYQIYHALLLLILANIKDLGIKLSKWVFYLILAGVFFFSGSIYLLSTNSLTGYDFKSIALITPLGGSLLILAWSILLVHFLKLKKK
jgi:uncharacterized membrane protein YgdD (TMEM256/DUF423 family)